MLLKNQHTRTLALAIGLAAIVLSTVITYAPTLSYGFLRWDDNVHIYNNSRLIEGDWKYFWKQAFFGLYIPLIYSAWSFIYSWGHQDALVFRVFNLTLHSMNILLVALVLKRLLAQLGARHDWLWLPACAIFALHPLQVEAVAWISGGRDLLATTFALLALLTTLILADWRGTTLGLAFFTLGMLSKPSIASLPLILILVWNLDKTRPLKTNLKSLLIWSLPLGALTLINSVEQQNVIQLKSLWWRPLVAADSLGFYAIKSLAPLHLALDYGRSPEFLAAQIAQNWLPSTVAAVLAALIIWSYQKPNLKKLSWFIAAWATALLPISGIIPFAFQEFSSVADRYNYFPMIFAAGAVVSALDLVLQKRRAVLLTVLIGYTVSLGTISLRRIPVWKDNQTFYSEMYAKNPNSFSALMGMGSLASDQGRDEEALSHYQKAETLRPLSISALDGILMSLTRLQKFDTAFDEESRLMKPNFARVFDAYPRNVSNIFTSLGIAHHHSGHTDVAADYFCFASQLNPENPNYRKNASAGLVKANKPNCSKVADFESWLEQRAHQK